MVTGVKNNSLQPIIYNRTIVETVRRAAERHGIAYTTYSDDWIIVLEKNGRRHIICGYAFGINTDAASSLADDKVATYQLLEAAGLPAIPHYLLSTVVDPGVDTSMLSALLSEHSDLVIKPLKGSRGDLVARLHGLTPIVCVYPRQRRAGMGGVAVCRHPA